MSNAQIIKQIEQAISKVRTGASPFLNKKISSQNRTLVDDLISKNFNLLLETNRFDIIEEAYRKKIDFMIDKNYQALRSLPKIEQSLKEGIKEDNVGVLLNFVSFQNKNFHFNPEGSISFKEMIQLSYESKSNKCLFFLISMVKRNNLVSNEVKSVVNDLFFHKIDHDLFLYLLENYNLILELGFPDFMKNIIDRVARKNTDPSVKLKLIEFVSNNSQYGESYLPHDIFSNEELIEFLPKHQFLEKIAQRRVESFLSLPKNEKDQKNVDQFNELVSLLNTPMAEFIKKSNLIGFCDHESFNQFRLEYVEDARYNYLSKPVKKEIYQGLYRPYKNLGYLFSFLFKEMTDQLLENKDLDQNLILPLIIKIKNFTNNQNEPKKIIPSGQERIIAVLFNPNYSIFASLLTWNQKVKILDSLLSGEDQEFVKDTIYMINRIDSKYKKMEINKHFKEENRIKNPRSIKKLHDMIQFWTSVDKIKDIPTVPLQKFDGKMVEDFKIFIPKTNLDLYKTGLELSICVGNGHYFEKILSQSSQILILVKDDKPVYCIEYDWSAKTIIQGKGWTNKAMPKSLKRKLDKLINPSWFDILINKIRGKK